MHPVTVNGTFGAVIGDRQPFRQGRSGGRRGLGLAAWRDRRGHRGGRHQHQHDGRHRRRHGHGDEHAGRRHHSFRHRLPRRGADRCDIADGRRGGGQHASAWRRASPTSSCTAPRPPASATRSPSAPTAPSAFRPPIRIPRTPTSMAALWASSRSASSSPGSSRRRPSRRRSAPAAGSPAQRRSPSMPPARVTTTSSGTPAAYGIIAGSGGAITAEDDPTVIATVGTATTLLASGAIEVKATDTATATAEMDGINLGGVQVGVGNATANIKASELAEIGSGATLAGNTAASSGPARSRCRRAGPTPPPPRRAVRAVAGSRWTSATPRSIRPRARQRISAAARC